MINVGLRDQRGQAIVLVVVLLTMMMVAVTALSTLSKNQGTIYEYRREKAQAFYYADGGIERVLAALGAGSQWVDNLPVGKKTTFYKDEYVTVVVEKGNDLSLMITSTGTYRKGKQTLEAVIGIEETGPDRTFKVLLWKEKNQVLPD